MRASLTKRYLIEQCEIQQTEVQLLPSNTIELVSQPGSHILYGATITVSVLAFAGSVEAKISPPIFINYAQ
jgi:hypothetical protein